MAQKNRQTKEQRAENRRTIRKLLIYAKPIRWWLVLACVLMLGAIACVLTAPQVLGDVIQELYDYWDRRGSGAALRLRPRLLLLFCLYGLQSLLAYLKMLLLNNVVSRYFTCHIRIRISEKLKRLPVSFVDGTPVGELIHRMVDDVSRMGNTIHELIDTIVGGFMQMSAIAVVMLYKEWRLALVVILLLPLSVLLSTRLSERSGKYFREMRRQSGELYAVVEESYTNYATTKAYRREEQGQERHEACNRRQEQAEARANYLASVVQPLISFTNAIAYIVINLLGGWMVVSGQAEVGTVVTIVLFAKQIAHPLEQIAGGMSNLQRAGVAAGRVIDLLEMPEETPIDGHISADEVQGRVTLEDVSFSYDKTRPLLQNINITVQPGQKIAIVGPTGAGKTTIVNLLMRFYDVDSGRILIDGTDLSAVSREESRSLFAMVLQDTWLFGGTIAENVAYGKPHATREEIVRACDEAYCDHFIRTLPDGYDTVVDEDNLTLSGGQKQLLTIARALLSDRKLLILDEATSNVDTCTEVLLQKAMDQLMHGRTSFVIAHRLSTIVNADLILVIRDGQLVEQGRHQELLGRKGFYYQLYTSQYAAS